LREPGGHNFFQRLLEGDRLRGFLGRFNLQLLKNRLKIGSQNLNIGRPVGVGLGRSFGLISVRGGCRVGGGVPDAGGDEDGPGFIRLSLLLGLAALGELNELGLLVSNPVVFGDSMRRWHVGRS
jgi:hypothetical protein